MPAMRLAITALAVGVSLASWAQPSPSEARKPYIRCAAVYGLAATTAKEERAKEGYTSASMLLTVWASELDPAIPSKDALDLATRELGAEIQLLAADVKKARESAAAREQFQQSFAQEARRCREFFSEVSKNKPKKN